MLTPLSLISFRRRLSGALLALAFCLPLTAQAESSSAQAITAARAVMEDFMTHFNARDEDQWAGTLLFPHIRVASGSVIVTPTKAEFVANMDFDVFAETQGWHHSEWDSIEVIQAGPDKVHFKVVFSRFNDANERYATFNSLYVLQREGDHWGIRARSSFAP